MTAPLIARDDDTLIPVTPHTDEALRELRPQLTALDRRKLSRPNIDPNIAAGRALAVATRLAPLRERIERECPLADLAALAQLQTRAEALLAAHSHCATPATTAVLDSLGTEVKEARGVLAAVAAMLVACNLFKAAQVPKLRPGRGYRIAAGDALALVSLFEQNWARIEQKVPVTRAQLERLRGVSEQVMRLVGEHAQSPRGESNPADVCQRALTLVEQSYDEARRVVTFLRWHQGDADQFVPPLRARHPGRKRGHVAEGDTGEATSAGGEEADAHGDGGEAGGGGQGGGTDEPVAPPRAPKARRTPRSRRGR